MNNFDDSLTAFMFGSPKNPNEISFVSKVNILCDDVAGIKKDFKSCVFAILGSCFTFLTITLSTAVFLGGQFKAIETNTQNIQQFVQVQHSIEQDIAILKGKCR